MVHAARSFSGRTEQIRADPRGKKWETRCKTNWKAGSIQPASHPPEERFGFDGRSPRDVRINQDGAFLTSKRNKPDCWIWRACRGWGEKEKEWRPLDWTSPAQAPQERIFAPFAPALSTSLCPSLPPWRLRLFIRGGSGTGSPGEEYAPGLRPQVAGTASKLQRSSLSLSLSSLSPLLLFFFPRGGRGCEISGLWVFWGEGDIRRLYANRNWGYTRHVIEKKEVEWGGQTSLLVGFLWIFHVMASGFLTIAVGRGYPPQGKNSMHRFD
jgi:hypothetical protein